jgi:hypothetical protein
MPSKVTGIHENPSRNFTDFRQIRQSSARASHPGADHIDLRRVGRLLDRIPKKHPDPPILRIEWPSSWPAAGCPKDWPLCLAPVITGLTNEGANTVLPARPSRANC